MLLLAGVLAAQTAPKSAPTSTIPATKKPASTAAKSAAPRTAPESQRGATTAKPTATFETTAGTLTCELFPDKAPNAVANFAGLATGAKDWTDPRSGQRKHLVPLYDGTIFHRVIPNFMIQGGDPGGDGRGQIGYTVNDEFAPDLKFDKPGVLAYANRGPNTNGSQFFITEVEYPFLDPCLDEGGCMRGMNRVPKGYGYVIFGQCTPESVELIKKIAREPKGAGDRPENPVKVLHVKITGMKQPLPKNVPAPPARRRSPLSQTPAKRPPSQ